MAYNIPSSLEIREKLKVECPDLIKQAGLTQLDFGKLFLTPESEAVTSAVLDTTDSIINITDNIDNVVSEEMITAISNTLMFIGNDIREQLLSYCTSVFKTYISPEYAAQLGMTLIRSTLRYTEKYYKDPADIYKELTVEYEQQVEDALNQAAEKEKEKTLKKINNEYSKTIEGIKKIVNELTPYITILKRAAIMGPDYITTEVVALYKKYLSIGISYIDTIIGQLQITVDSAIDYSANKIGYTEAMRANKMQEKLLRKNFNKVKIQEAKIKAKAMSVINKSTLKILSLLGG